MEGDSQEAGRQEGRGVRVQERGREKRALLIDRCTVISIQSLYAEIPDTATGLPRSVPSWSTSSISLTSLTDASGIEDSPSRSWHCERLCKGRKKVRRIRERGRWKYVRQTPSHRSNRRGSVLSARLVCDTAPSLQPVHHILVLRIIFSLVFLPVSLLLPALLLCTLFIRCLLRATSSVSARGISRSSGSKEKLAALLRAGGVGLCGMGVRALAMESARHFRK